MKRVIAGAVAIASLVLGAESASAQTTVFLSAGAGVPTGDYGEYANLGFMAQGGIFVPVGPPGLSVGAGGFFGMNNHDSPPDGDKTQLYGALAFLAYSIGEAGSVQPYLFGGPGFMTHSYKSETFPEGSGSGLAAGAGGGLNIPLGGLTPYLEGMYMTGFGDEIDGTDLFIVSAGVNLPLG